MPANAKPAKSTYWEILANCSKTPEAYHSYLLGLNLDKGAELMAFDAYSAHFHLYRLYRAARTKRDRALDAENLRLLARFALELVESLQSKESGRAQSLVLTEALERRSQARLKRRAKVRELDQRDPFKPSIRRSDPLTQKIISLHERIVLERAHPTIGFGDWGQRLAKLHLERLPPLNSESRTVWARAMRYYLWTGINCGIFDADAEMKLVIKYVWSWRELARRKRKAEQRLKARYPNEKSLSVVEATHLQERRKRIDTMKATGADIWPGFQEAINERLRSMLRQ